MASLKSILALTTYLNLQFLLLDSTCPAFNNNKKLQSKPKGEKKIQSLKRKKSPEPDSDIPLMVELEDREFKMMIINMSRPLMEKVDSMQK